MPDVNPYIEKLYEARSLLIRRQQSDLQRAMIVSYSNQIQRVIDLLNSGQISPDNASKIISQLKVSLRAWQGNIEDITKRYAIETIDGVGKIHSSIVGQVSKAFNVELGINLNGFRADAYEAMFARRGLGSVKTFQTLNNWNAYGAKAIEGIETALTEGIKSGTSFRKVQADVARSLAFGNRDTRGLLEAVKGRDTFSLSSLKIGGSETTRTINKLLSDARRIAVTEIDVAYHEGERIASIRNPIVKALKWQTSGRHDSIYSSPDICDVYEDADMYDLGPGVYPPEVLPVKPHPNCGCTRLFVTREANEWRMPKENPGRPDLKKKAEIQRILENHKNSRSRTITNRYIETTFQQTNTDVKRAYGYYAKQEAA